MEKKKYKCNNLQVSCNIKVASHNLIIMELVLKRIAKKKGYTIGQTYMSRKP